MVYKLFFLFQSLFIFSWYYFIYKFDNNFDKFIINLTNSLGNINIFYIKIFQSLATNSLFLTPEQIQYMSKYTNNVSYIYDDIDFEFVKTIELIKSKNDDLSIEMLNGCLPTKAGTIALIYEGIMNGRKVVIKVQRKNIKEKLVVALDNIEIVYNVFLYFWSLDKYNLKYLISENRDSLLNQINFDTELNNLKQSAHNFKNLDNIIIPTVYEEFTHQNNKMLVMDYIYGNHLIHVKHRDKDDYSKLVSQYGVKSFLFNNLYHADLHSGNILFLNENGVNKIAILDFGIMGRLTKEEQNIYYNLIVAITNHDVVCATQIIMENLIEPKDIVMNMTVSNQQEIEACFHDIISTSIKEKSSISLKEISKLSTILNNFDLFFVRWISKVEMALAIADSVSRELLNNKSQVEVVKEMIDEFQNILN